MKVAETWAFSSISNHASPVRDNAGLSRRASVNRCRFKAEESQGYKRTDASLVSLRNGSLG